MISFILSILALFLGYIFYGKYISRLFGPDDRPTPAVSKADGVDYIVMPSWRIFMIQFLNIAGTGPIFGAIMGAKFGPSAYFWIVLGCIFAGAVHDYLSGMLSVRNGGVGLPELVGIYLGKNTKKVVIIFTVFLLMMVGAVFIDSPAIILGDLTKGSLSVYFWLLVIFAYYIIATMLPVDKIIGKIYPLFAFSLIFMAVSLMTCLFIKMPALPEVWDEPLLNRHEALGPIFPCLFITIACGAISGFHATQSPLMARCIKHERQGRPIFYGAMITEGLVALIWATVSSYFFYDGGAAAVGLTESASAPQIVNAISSSWLGTFGGVLALLGVVAAPITSGDTALRSARLILAEFFKITQKPVKNRLAISIPIFMATALLLWFNVANEDGFNVIWQYFGWSNQVLSVFTLWALTVYLVRNRKNYYVTLIPALFMTVVCVTFLMVSPIAFHLSESVSYIIGFAGLLAAIIWFIAWFRRQDATKQS